MAPSTPPSVHSASQLQTELDAGLRHIAGLAPGVLTVDSVACQRLLDLAEITARWSQQMNLTGFNEASAVMRHLILDALALASQLPSWATLCDIGSGAGFPGLPIACVSPEQAVLLVESRERRHHFQREAKRRLELSQVRCLRGRAEELTPEPCDLALSQALAEPARAMVLLAPWAAPGGHVALALSAEQARESAGRDVEDRFYVAPDGRERCLRLLSAN